ncbi:MAG: radical SAM protein [Gammaproteobacteria bacterium]|nr:radical SAM protein [Gammaproteobacteria bacterium]
MKHEMNYSFPTPEGAGFPSMVVLAINNACNYRCIHCYYPTYIKQPDFHRHDMTPEVFRKIADEIGLHPHANLRLIGWGEPLFHPRLIEYTGYVRNVARHNKITLITNGCRLTKDYSRALMEAGLDLVEVSIDAATAATYAKVRISKDADALSVVEKNVRDMAAARDRLGYRTQIAVSFVAWPTEESEAEFAAFREKWRGSVDEVLKRPLHSFKGVNRNIKELPEKRRACYGLWARCGINPWGQISVCYNDWENKYLLGDLRDSDTTISGIWQGHQLNNWRTEQARGVFTGCCAKCRDYNPNAWQHPYEEIIFRCPAPRRNEEKTVSSRPAKSVS